MNTPIAMVIKNLYAHDMQINVQKAGAKPGLQ